jgi:hypothetical protein
VRDLSNLSKSGRMFGWFPHLVNSGFASGFGLNHLFLCAKIIFIFLIFVGIFGLIFILAI